MNVTYPNPTNSPWPSHSQQKAFVVERKTLNNQIISRRIFNKNIQVAQSQLQAIICALYEITTQIHTSEENVFVPAGQ
jgi:hypothetical protein